MGSALQVEQVIGRVLRQPGARHYAHPDLNTANFYIRIDSRQDFPRILDVVRKKISSELPEVKLDGFNDASDRKRARRDPKEELTIPEIHIDADLALAPLRAVVDQIHDYTTDNINVRGPGQLTRALQKIGDGSPAKIETIEKEHSNRVIARWLIRRTMQTLYPEAAKTVDWADPRFEARVEVTSRAANHLREEAEKLVDVYLANAELAFEESNPYRIAAVLCSQDHTVRFGHSLHSGYSDLNPLETEFAHAIDATGLKWVRNPVNGGYSIPLLEKGDSRKFFPDFIVWKKELVFALDPKGDHLITKDAGLKLLNIRDEKGRQRVVVRLITEGRWTHDPIKKLGGGGFSVWRLNSSGKTRCTHHMTPKETVEKCLEI
jgi:type III restriction enzyme